MNVLENISKQTRLFNSFNAIRWNSIKYYQRYLSENGITTIPTLWPDDFSHMSPNSIFDYFNTDRLIAKPIIGACAERQILFSRRNMPLLQFLYKERYMIQRFYPSISTQGEISLIYFGGSYSHSALKLPAIGDYRVQGIFGGSESTFTPSSEYLSASQRILDATPYDTLYARVDLFRLPEGRLALMELEIVEPYLYLQFVPDYCAKFMQSYIDELEGIRSL